MKRKTVKSHGKPPSIEELDRQYVESYRQLPESTEFADAQVKMLAEILEPEDWSDVPGEAETS
jgi:hypothetical protein